MHGREMKPIWTTSSFLVYTGGLTVLGAGIGALAYLDNHFRGHGEKTAWAILIFACLFAVAYVLRRADRPIAAGVFAFAAVIAFAIVVVRAFEWAGWNGVHASERQWSWAALGAQLLILMAAWDARRRFRFPFVRLISAVLFFAFVVQLLPAGGNWTATWALIVGLLYLLVGNVAGKPSAFWLHLVGGGLIGGAFLWWFHTSDVDFAVIAIVALAYVLVAHRTHRSSWAVWGTIGFFIATVHYLVGSPTELAQGFVGAGSVCTGTGPGPGTCTSVGPHLTAWSFPLGFGLLGFWLVLLGILGRRRRAAVVPPPPPAPAAG